MTLRPPDSSVTSTQLCEESQRLCDLSKVMRDHCDRLATQAVDLLRQQTEIERQLKSTAAG